MNELHMSTERLIDYVHGELPANEDAAVHAHLAECEQCRNAYDEESRLTDMLRAHAKAEERELPPGVVASIRAAVEEVPAPWWQRLTLSWRPVAVAAAIVAGIFVGTFVSMRSFHSHAQASTIDAAYYLDDHACLSHSTPFDDAGVVPASLTSGSTESEEQPDGDATH